MPKIVSVGALAKLNTRYGTEPQIVVAVQWKDAWAEYKDEILEIGELDDVINVEGDSNSIELNVKLTDLDGTLKNLFNTTDIHKRPVKVYQAWAGTDDRILLMTGEVSTPVVWVEGDRTLSFSVLTKLEEKEIGFSPEESKLNIAPELSSQPWPLAFGKVVNIPAVKVKQVVRGTLREAIGVPDPSLNAKYNALMSQAAILQAQVAYFLAAQVMASAMSSQAQVLLQSYLDVIIEQYEYITNIFQLQFDLAVAQRNMALWNKPDKRNPFFLQIENIRADIMAVANIANDAAIRKQQIENDVKACTAKGQATQDILSKLASVFDDQRRVAASIEQILQMMSDQAQYDVSSFGVNGGEKFPQNQAMSIIVKGVKISGQFSGNTFTVGTTALATYTSVQMDTRQNSDPNKFWIQNDTLQLKGMYALVGTSRVGSPKKIIKISEQVGKQISFDLTDYQAPTNNGVPDTPTMPTQDTISPNVVSYLQGGNVTSVSSEEESTIIELQKAAQSEINYAPQLALALNNIAAFLTPRYEIEGTEIIQILEVAGNPLPSWFEGATDAELAAQTQSKFWFADSGSEVRLSTDNEQVYVANILESDVVSVQAKKNGKLTPLPDRYYTVTFPDLNTLTPTIITTKLPINEIEGEGWEDSLYVSLESSVGPNVVDVMKWVIETYTDDDWDPTTFNYVAGKVAKKHANFVTFDRKQVLDFLKEVAMQACCSIWNIEGVYYLKYLAEEPASTATLTESDVLTQTLQVSFSPTEDIVTKVNATWHSDYYISDPNRMILRHNVNKYGTMERDIDFYIYSDEDNVQRAATFWMIRWCNTWKILECTASLRKLSINTLDTITLDFQSDYVADGPIKGNVEKATYSPDGYEITLQVWCPVRAGEMVQYNFAWPADLDITVTFPAADDEENAGSQGPGADASGNIGTVGDITSRPGDFGAANLGDSSQLDPNNPLAGFGGGNNGQLQNLSPFQLQLLRAVNAVINGDFALLPQNREVMMGTVISQAGVDNSFTVIVSNGTILNDVKQFRFDATETVAVGTAVPIVRGNDRATFFMQAPVHKPTVQELRVIEEFDDWLTCADVDDNEVIVAKPPEARRTSYDGAFFNGHGYKYLTYNTRSVTENKDPGEEQWKETFYPPYYLPETDPATGFPDYDTGGRIYAAYTEDTGVPGPNGNNLKWVDINCDGRSWKYDSYDFIVIDIIHNSNLEDPKIIMGQEGKIVPDWREGGAYGPEFTDEDVAEAHIKFWGPPGSPKPTELPTEIYNPNRIWLHAEHPYGFIILRRVSIESFDQNVNGNSRWIIDGNPNDFELVTLNEVLTYGNDAEGEVVKDDLHSPIEASETDPPTPGTEFTQIRVKDAFLKSGDSLPLNTIVGAHRRGGIWWAIAARCS